MNSVDRFQNDRGDKQGKGEMRKIRVRASRRKKSFRSRILEGAGREWNERELEIDEVIRDESKGSTDLRSARKK
jgi:soluble lytic murein transglycosylase-like protein